MNKNFKGGTQSISQSFVLWLGVLSCLIILCLFGRHSLYAQTLPALPLNECDVSILSGAETCTGGAAVNIPPASSTLPPNCTPPSYCGAKSEAMLPALAPIYAYGYCYYVDNSSPNSFFVPFSTQQEWVTGFISNHPATLSLVPCVIPQTNLAIPPDVSCTNPNPATGSANETNYVRAPNTWLPEVPFTCMDTAGVTWTEYIQANFIGTNTNGNNPMWVLNSTTCSLVPYGSPGWPVPCTTLTPPTISLVANPTSVTDGSTTTLTWTVTNATNCTAISPTNETDWTGPVSFTGGTQIVTPGTQPSTDYNLSCTGKGGTTVASVTVTVLPPTPTVSLTASVPAVITGGSVDLTWVTANVTSCTATAVNPEPDWTGTVVANGGTQTVTPLTAPNTVFTISCTGPGGNATSSVTIALTPLPVITLAANPTTISVGSTSTLTWTVTNATSCTASGESDWTGSVSATGGTQVVTPATLPNTVFSLSCSGPGGTSSTSVTIGVSQPLPSVTLVAAPSTVTLGNTSTLTWTVSNATSCTASGTTDFTGSVSVAGASQVVTPATVPTTLYTITCTGPGGTVSANASVTVTVPLPTVTLVSTPLTVALGSPVVLSWTVTNATTCTASGAADFSGSVAVTGGSTSVIPTTTPSQTYNVTCTGLGGSATASATVTVYPPPSVTFNGNPTTVDQGSTTTLSWTVTNATSCLASGASDWSGSVSTTGGSQVVTPGVSPTTTYTLTCSGQGGSVTLAVYITIVPPVSVTLTASSSSIYKGESIILTSTPANATSCLASSAEPDWSGTISTAPMNGTVTPASLPTTTFSVTCSNGATSATASVTIAVLNPGAYGGRCINAGGAEVCVSPSSGHICYSETIVGGCGGGGTSIYFQSPAGDDFRNGFTATFPETIGGTTTNYTITTDPSGIIINGSTYNGWSAISAATVAQCP